MDKIGEELLNGLDVFSGIGGISFALREWVKPIAYCEIDPFCQKVLLSNMARQQIVQAPIWDDIRTMSGTYFPREEIDIIYGGFPCQDISIAGSGKGLEGERSGLFFEMLRIIDEIRPSFIFLENVPAITRRGGMRVIRDLASIGYDCRWCVISAASVGALHRRERWFLLGNSNCQPSEQTDTITESKQEIKAARRRPSRLHWPFESRDDWQEAVSTMGKCSDGVSEHVARLRALGNAVVPQQVRKAWEILMGLK